jgi:nucleotide-binding universal stress UspA family protein
MNVVAAFNQSEDSRAAVLWAAEVAAHSGGEVHVVYAVPAPAIPSFSSPKLVDELIAAASEAARRPLDAIVAEVRARGVRAQGHLRRWLVADAVIEKATEVGAALIVIGRRGSARLTQLLIGTVSAEVVRLAPQSVLVVHKDELPGKAPRVVVGVDGSPHSVRAIAVARATFPDAKLVCLHAGAAKPADGEDVVRKAAGAAGVAGVEIGTRPGDAAAELIAAASEKDVRALVVGPRGLGQLAGLLLGSVTEKVLQLSRKPVLVAR